MQENITTEDLPVLMFIFPIMGSSAVILWPESQIVRTIAMITFFLSFCIFVFIIARRMIGIIQWYKSKRAREGDGKEERVLGEPSTARKFAAGEQFHSMRKSNEHKILFWLHACKYKIPFWDGGEGPWVNWQREFRYFDVGDMDTLLTTLEDMKKEGWVATNVIIGNDSITPNTLIRITIKGEEKLKELNNAH